MTPKLSLEKIQAAFAAVERLPEHAAWDAGPYLRDFGFNPYLASRLCAWGEPLGLVCWLEDARGKTDGVKMWRHEFLKAAYDQYVALYGADDDLPAAFAEHYRAGGVYESQAMRPAARPR
jgi:hypothetical protein